MTNTDQHKLNQLILWENAELICPTNLFLVHQRTPAHYIYLNSQTQYYNIYIKDFFTDKIFLKYVNV